MESGQVDVVGETPHNEAEEQAVKVEGEARFCWNVKTFDFGMLKETET